VGVEGRGGEREGARRERLIRSGRGGGGHGTGDERKKMGHSVLIYEF